MRPPCFLSRILLPSTHPKIEPYTLFHNSSNYHPQVGSGASRDEIMEACSVLDEELPAFAGGSLVP